MRKTVLFAAAGVGLMMALASHALEQFPSGPTGAAGSRAFIPGLILMPCIDAMIGLPSGAGVASHPEYL
jgi:hypothetical protein